MKQELTDEQKKSVKRKTNIVAAVVVCAAAFYIYHSVFEEKPDPLPAVQVEVTSTVPGVKLGMDCMLPGEVDAATLGKLAERTCRAQNCDGFDNVFVAWMVPGYKKNAGAWATSIRRGKGAEMKTEIVRLQDVAKDAEAAAKK